MRLAFAVGIVLLAAGSMTACRGGASTATQGTPATIEALTATPEAKPTDSGELSRVFGRGMSLELPDRFTAGDLENDVGVLADELSSAGPPFDRVADILVEHPELIRLLAFDTTDTPPTAVIATVEHVLSVTTLDQYGDILAKQLQTAFPAAEIMSREPATVGGFEALRVAISLPTRGSRHNASLVEQGDAGLLLYVLKLGSVVWTVEMATPLAESSERFRDFDQAIQTFRPEFIRMSAPSVDSSAGCGAGASISLAGDSPIGQVYHAGETVRVIVRYAAPGCTVMVGIVAGYHGEASDWYQYWCVDHPGTAKCAGHRVASTMTFFPMKLIDTDRSLVGRLNARSGSMPPTSIDSPPPADGFTPCIMILHVGDADGNGADYQLGETC